MMILQLLMGFNYLVLLLVQKEETFKRGTPIAKKFSEMTIDEVDAVYSGKSSYIGTDYEGMPLFNTVPVQYNRTGRFVDREVKLGKYQLSYKDFTHLRENFKSTKRFSNDT